MSQHPKDPSQDPKMSVLACLVLDLYPEKLRAWTIPIFPEPELEPEPQSCFAIRVCIGADSTVELVAAVQPAPMLESEPNAELVPVPAVEPAPMLESVPNVELVPECMKLNF